MHRRTFIAQTPLAAAALLGPSGILCTPSAERKLGVALMGLGNYATRQLAPALQKTQHCRLTGIVTGSPAKAETWKKQYGIPDKNAYNYDNFDRIRDNPDIDIVYVVLPNSMHAEYSIRAAQAGKHVVCEKPMALNVRECEQMIAACKTAGVQLGVGYRLYYEPHHLEMKRLGTGKVYGAVKTVESSLGFSMADPTTWRLDKAMGGGGAIMDLGVYCIQGARRTVGELPVAVTAQGYVRNADVFKGIYEMVMFQLEFPGGAVSNSTTTYSSYVDRLHASSDYRWFGLQPSYNATGAKGETFEGKMAVLAPEFQQTAQLDAFARDVLAGRTPEASGEEGLIVLRIIEAVVQAADGGKRVVLKW
jgi:predicted dehydrogenase